MRSILIGVVALLTAGCAATYTQPTLVAPLISKSVDATKTEILSAAKKVLVYEGYQITYSDEKSGLISTALRNHRITPEQADCGTTMGIDYLKDNRTSTKVGFNVIADDGKITVKATIEGEYKPGSVDQDITLTCVSRGMLERIILDKIINKINQ